MDPVEQTLIIGENGTKTLSKRYGDSLVCVRYRRCARTGARYKTVELKLRAYEAPALHRADFYQRETVHLQISWEERELQPAIKQAGGRWEPEAKLWKVNGATVERLRLWDRVVQPTNEQPST